MDIVEKKNTLFTCYLMLCKLHEKDQMALKKIKDLFGERNIGEKELKKVSSSIKLKFNKKQVNYNFLLKLKQPFIAQNIDNEYILIGKIDEERVLRFCPQKQENGIVDREEFQINWNSKILTLENKNILSKSVEFGLKWFFKIFKIYKKEFANVLLGNFSILVFSLILPLMTQTIVDKVLLHNGFSTLNVLTVIFLTAVLLEFFIKLAKDYLLLFTSTKIDMILGTKLFKHLFHLPIAYFENRSVGIISNRIKELENVREFLSGTPLNSFFDLFFIGLYLIFLWIYSPVLTGIVVIFLPVMMIFSFIMIPKYKKYIEQRAQTSAKMEAFLIESLTGVNAVKSFALEANIKNRWGIYQAESTGVSFKSSTIGVIYGITNEKFQRFINLLLLIVGSFLVIDKKMTIGQLIAFRMIAANLMNHLLKLVELLRDFEQVKISISNLGEILNSPLEIKREEKGIKLEKADIQFRNINFRYSLEGDYVIKNMNFSISDNEVVAFVGRSGSGKSTVTKLLQKMYTAEEGEVLINGHNIKTLNANGLRENIGVVMQENYLFNGTIRDNIALKQPGANIEAVINSAKLAGAHDFILELPDAYDTMIGERGTGLSGGQRQRIAIARALLTNPKILIFDEATSALDYESEKIIKDNMKEICKERTVIMIAHRLSTIKDCDTIYVVEQGSVLESGSHNELLEKKGFYGYLHDLQRGV